MKLKRAVGVALGLWAAYTIYRFGYRAVQPPGFIPFDFAVFYKAVANYFAGNQVYIASEASPYKYSLTILYVLRSLFSFFSRGGTWVLWVALSASLWSYAVYRWFFSLEKQNLTFLVLGIVSGWHGYLEHYSYGQSDALLFSAIVFAAVSIRNLGARALILSLCLLTKPHLAIFLAYWAFLRDWRTVTTTLAVTAALFFAPVLAIGTNEFARHMYDWKTVLTQQQDASFYTGNLNQSLGATLARISLHPEGVQKISTLVLALGSAVLALQFATKKSRAKMAKLPRPLLLTLCFSFFLVLAPISWRWATFAWAPMTAALAVRFNKRDKLQLALAGTAAVAVLLLQQNFARLLGIHEIDELSWAGFYTLVSVCLGGITLRQLVRASAPNSLS